MSNYEMSDQALAAETVIVNWYRLNAQYGPLFSEMNLPAQFIAASALYLTAGNDIDVFGRQFEHDPKRAADSGAQFISIVGTMAPLAPVPVDQALAELENPAPALPVELIEEILRLLDEDSDGDFGDGPIGW